MDSGSREEEVSIRPLNATHEDEIDAVFELIGKSDNVEWLFYAKASCSNCDTSTELEGLYQGDEGQLFGELSNLGWGLDEKNAILHCPQCLDKPGK